MTFFKKSHKDSDVIFVQIHLLSSVWPKAFLFWIFKISNCKEGKKWYLLQICHFHKHREKLQKQNGTCIRYIIQLLNEPENVYLRLRLSVLKLSKPTKLQYFYTLHIYESISNVYTVTTPSKLKFLSHQPFLGNPMVIIERVMHGDKGKWTLPSHRA